MTDDKNSPAAAQHETTSITGPTEVREGAQAIISQGLADDWTPPPATLNPPPPIDPVITGSESVE